MTSVQTWGNTEYSIDILPVNKHSLRVVGHSRLKSQEKLGEIKQSSAFMDLEGGLLQPYSAWENVLWNERELTITGLIEMMKAGSRLGFFLTDAQQTKAHQRLLDEGFLYQPKDRKKSFRHYHYYCQPGKLGDYFTKEELMTYIKVMTDKQALATPIWGPNELHSIKAQGLEVLLDVPLVDLFQYELPISIEDRTKLGYATLRFVQFLVYGIPIPLMFLTTPRRLKGN